MSYLFCLMQMLYIELIAMIVMCHVGQTDKNLKTRI